jgi:hypothetical protein
MIKFKEVKLLLELSCLLGVCRHAGVMAIQLPHDLVDHELRVTADVESLDPELGGDAQAIEEGLIFCYLMCCVEM